ncbi:MAG: hypothetical protein ABL995_02810 [Bryobacteraceae bacterium]
MNTTFKALTATFLLAGLVTLTSAADQTWTGEISDSSCGVSHASMTKSHPGMTERDCVLACVKGGGKYVFVSDGKVFQIANQGLPLLQTHAGHTVRLTGEMRDDTITVSNLDMPAKK